MPTYDYQAMDKTGASVTGQLEAHDVPAAQDALRARGLFVSSLTERRDATRPRLVTLPTAARADTRAEAPAAPTSRPAGRWGALLFGLVFFLVGGVFLVLFTLRPLWLMSQAADWVATPCTIVSSELKAQRGDDSTTYRIEIVYGYDYLGRHYQADRYDFLGMSSNTNGGYKQAAVAAHPPGAKATCYVNPANPTAAVIVRGWTPEMWWGLFPLPFVTVGVVGLLAGFGLLRLPQRARRA